MATLQLINNLGTDIELADVGFTIPPSGDTFTNPDHLRKLSQSDDLRSRLTAEDLTANDGVANLSTAEALVYLSLLWQQGGRSDVAGMRVIASGQTLINANTTVDLATITKFQTERLQIFLFPTNDVNGLAFASSLALLGDSIRGFFERTNVANQCKVRASNGNLVTSRTVDWTVVGIRV
jgi:hypothetical protein